MTESATVQAWGELIEPTTLKIQRLLPGPIERVWAYLTESELRRRWLASGDMKLEQGASFELVWRNDELTDPPGRRPDGFGEEHRMSSRITELAPPHRLAFTWGQQEGSVCFELEVQGDEVLLTVTHRRLSDRNSLLNVSSGWHAHLDLLADLLTGARPQAHWDHWSRLREDYTHRLPE